MVLQTEIDKRLREIENKIAQIELCLQSLATHISCLTNKASQSVIPPGLSTSEKFDFEQIYKLYPRKLGKARGLTICKRIKSLAEFRDLEKALMRFIEYHRKKGTDISFIPHFNTFMGSWKDWLDPETATGEDRKQAPKQQQTSNHFQSQAARIMKGEL